ncbi:MAG: TIGR01212 family radical SAM protein [Desulfovibrionaceae bacterium]
MSTPRYFTLATYFRQRFGGRVRKIPLDAGFSCPNRDGTLGTGGCAYCNPQGSGTGLLARGLGLAEQWSHWSARFQGRGEARFLAYLQSYSNTHGPASRVAEVLEELAALPGLAGLALGTRPDCLDEERLGLLAAFPAEEVHLELGLQSANDATLARINRGHDAACFARATRAAAALGLKVVAHVMAGLPGETGEDFLHTIAFVNALPVHGVKLHNTLVCRHTPLERLHASGGYAPPGREEYAALAAEALARLRPGVLVHRINADPAPGELVAPAWAADKADVRAAIHAEMERHDWTQGCLPGLPRSGKV